VTVKEYGHALAHDAAYAAKAERIGALAKDLSELLPVLVPKLQERLAPVAAAGTRGRLAFHPPCTLQHGMKLRGGVESGLAALGFDVQLASGESHMCCGSAGTYSVLQPQLADELRDRKLAHLGRIEADTIVSANVGCIQHLQNGTTTPVRHWVEVVDEALVAA
jgi:glycolate oxidase iron-sulfur subunit